MKSGIYEIVNTTNGKRYVGSAVDIKGRFRHHRHHLRKGNHRNIHLQRAWNKYGESAFGFDVLEYWEPEFLVSFEQWWMNMLRPEYNIAPVAGSPMLGRIHTRATKAKMSRAGTGNARNLGNKHSEETRAKMSAAAKGRKHTLESKAKMSKAKTGNTYRLGHKLSPETREKISSAKIGKPWSALRWARYEARKKSD